MKKPFVMFIYLGWFTATATSAIADSQRICSSASAYLARNQMQLADGMLLISDDAFRTWTQASSFGQPELNETGRNERLHLAYFLTRVLPESGVISAKISLVSSINEKSNLVNVYRPTILRNSNRCEPRGRAEVNRSVRINQYIDYHDPAAGGINSTLEDLHFKYPLPGNQCGRTNDAGSLPSFQFENVSRTQGDTFIARNFPLFGTAYAIGHNFKMLRSELHYLSKIDAVGTCIGFSVPMNGSHQVSFVITEHGRDWAPLRKAWIINR